jgi:hypothetical protein
VIHVAGEMVGLVQLCTRCGEVLTDYNGCWIPDGDPRPRGWATGAHIEVERFNGMTSSVVVDGPANCSGLRLP